MAGLIPQSFIDDILDRVDIVEVIDRRVSLKKAGRNYTACCPFHDEKTPSFSVNPDKQFFYCFGCGAGGNSIGFIMDYDNVDFPAAVEILAGMLGLEVPREDSPQGQSQQRKSQSQNLYDTLAWTAKYFQGQLRQHANKQQAISYLKNRGLSGEVARDFGIGYAPPGWDNLLNAIETGDKKQRTISLLETSGMLVKKDNGDYYDRFRERIIFPIRDNRGRVIAFGGRVLNDDKPKYLNSPETPVFHKQRELYGLYEARKANRQLDYLLLVEGYMDVVSLVQYGISNAVATLGTASSIYHLEKIFRHTSKLVVCFDGDAAGAKAAARLLETALPAMTDGREICFLFLPEGEDPDTFVRDKGKQAFFHLVDQAKPLETVLFETASESINLESQAGLAKFSQQALPLIQKLPQGVFRQLLLKQLAEKTGAELSDLQAAAAKLGTSTKTEQSPAARTDSVAADSSRPIAQKPATKADTKTENEVDNTVGLEKTPVVWAIALLLHYPEFAREIPIPLALNDIPSDEAKLLLKLFEHILEQPGQVSTSTLLGYWHGTPEAVAINHCANRHKPPEEEEIARDEFTDTLQRIEEQVESLKMSRFIAELESKPLSELSAEDREMLLSLGANANKPG